MKNGSSAGRTLLIQSDMPFRAEYSAMVGNITIKMQHATVIKPAAIILFPLNLKISMIYLY